MQARITQDDVIYFIVTDRFFGINKRFIDPADKSIHGGTLDGILSKLDYLLHLGITAIWITPVYKNIDRFFDAEPYHYYWTEDFDSIDPRLLDGTVLPQETTKNTLAAFIDRCAAKGIKVILDMVVNHAGYGAESRFDPAWFNHGNNGDIKKPLDGLPDFNHDSPVVLDYFIRNIRSWITEGGVTNIRMDTVKHVEPKFWHYFKSQLRGQYADTFLLGEVLNQGKQDIPHLLEYQNFHDFDSLFDFPLATAIRQTLIFDESIPYWLARPRLSESEETGVLDNDNPLKGGYRNPNRLVTVLDNHDLDKRIFSYARTKHTGTGQGLQWAIRVTKLCLGLLMTARGIPQLYYGTELGLEGWKTEHGDHDMRRDFPWHWISDDQEPVIEQTTAAELYHWTRSLIALRKHNAAFRYGTTITLWSDTFVYAFLRIAIDDVALVVVNNGYEDMQVPVRLYLNPAIIPPVAITRITQDLRHWQTGAALAVENDHVLVQVKAKAMEVYCGNL